MPMSRNLLGAALLCVPAAAIGLLAGYVIWGWPPNWYNRDIAAFPTGPEGDLIRYGHDLVADTAAHLGKDAPDASLRLAGNNLACANCHLDAGLKPFGAPFVSTFATFPMLVDDQVLTLKNRINGCMRRSMNGKPLAHDSREMQALIAYIKYLGKGTPEGVRLAGMGLKPLSDPATPPDAGRGASVYTQFCASCHKDNGQGEAKPAPGIGYSIPPLWGDASFNAAAGMAKLDYAAAYIRYNMPLGVQYQFPMLSEQQAWDVAAFMVSLPRPKAPPEAAPELH